MALYNSDGTSEVEKTVSTYEDLSAFYVDTDGYPHGYMFGYTSHLMRRKAQVGSKMVNDKCKICICN